MARRALAFLDGGPAAGRVIELDEAEWAPKPQIFVQLDGMVLVYVRARQRKPAPGQPWRYVPSGSSDAEQFTDDGPRTDPTDD